MRIATWNIEWFSELFSIRDELLADGEPSRRHKTTRREQAEAIATVLSQLDADLVMIIEAPNTGHTQSTVRALENFADRYHLRQYRAIMGFPSPTHQEIAAIYDPNVLTVRHDPLESRNAPRFDGTFDLDIDIDNRTETHVFSKPPLEIEVSAEGLPGPIRMIGVHTKSKSSREAKTAQDAIELSILNRRKQLAQCIWLRARIDDMLEAEIPMMVMGDLNDGPGIDHYEKLFGRSSVEVVLGDPEEPSKMLVDPHAAAWLNPRQGWSMSTARFYKREFQQFVNVLLDYIMVSPDLAQLMKPRWRIWHPFDDPRIYEDHRLRDALLAASDHFPVSVDLG